MLKTAMPELRHSVSSENQGERGRTFAVLHTGRFEAAKARDSVTPG